MTSSKSTKRALVSSALALLMCLAMLVGATFAWLIDTASTGVNKIQAGNLDVALEMKDASASGSAPRARRWTSSRLLRASRFCGSRAVPTSCRSSVLSTRATLL